MSLPSVFGAAHFHDIAELKRVSDRVEQFQRSGLSRLPPEPALALQLDMDRSVLRRLLETLARDGMLVYVRRQGWLFSEPKLEIPVARHNSYAENMKRAGKVPKSLVVDVDQSRAEPLEFWEERDRWVWSFDFLRFNGPVAFSLARVQIPVDLTPGLNRLVGPDTSLYSVLEEHFGILPQRRTSWCESVGADTILADTLLVPVGTPLLKVTHWADWNGRPFEHTVNFLRGASARLRIELADVSEELPG